MTLPSLETTPIPGLVVVRLDRRDDDRGFFKENWQREKMLAIGLPDFGRSRTTSPSTPTEA